MKQIGVFGVALVLILAGCAHKPDIVGKWKIDISGMPGADSAAEAAMMKGIARISTFEFKADKTYSGGMMEGTYTMDGNKVSMTPTKVMGMDVSKVPGAANQPPQVGEISSDGKTLTFHTTKSGGKSQDMKLTRDTGQ